MNQNSGKIIFLFLVAVFSTSLFAKAQSFTLAPDSTGKTYGSTGNDRGVHTIKTTDNNLVTVGVTQTPLKDDDIFLVKTTLWGEKIWQKTFGGKKDDAGWHLMECDAAGNLLICGWSESYSADGNEDILLLKISMDGELIWIKTLAHPGNERCWSIIALKDHSYILTGQTQNSVSRKMNGLITKVDSEGHLIWQSVQGTENYNRLFYSRQLISGEILSAGITRKDSTSENQGWVTVIDKEGKLKNNTSLQSIKNITTHGVLETPKNEILVYGYAQTDTSSRQRTIYFTLFDDQGNLKWEKAYNERFAETHGIGAVLSSANNILLTGYTRPVSGGNWKGVLYRFSLKGKMQWRKEFGGSGISQPYSLLEIPKHRFVVTGLVKNSGKRDEDMWLVWFDEHGNISR